MLVKEQWHIEKSHFNINAYYEIVFQVIVTLYELSRMKMPQTTVNTCVGHNKHKVWFWQTAESLLKYWDQFSTIEIRSVLSHAKLMISWLKWLKKNWGAWAR